MRFCFIHQTKSPVTSRRSYPSAVPEAVVSLRSSQSNDAASRSVATQRMNPAPVNRSVDNYSKSAGVLSPVRNRASSDSMSSAGCGGKARMKIVDITTCLSGERNEHRDEMKKTSVSTVKGPISYSTTEVEQQARSIAELDSIAAQTRQLSASVNNTALSARVAGQTNLRTEGTTRPIHGSSTSIAVHQRGVVATVSGPHQMTGRASITTSGIIRKQLIYLDSVLNPLMSTPSTSGTGTGTTGAAISGTSPTAKRVVRKSQTTDLTSLGLGNVIKGAVTAKSSPITTKVATTSGDFENLRRRGGSAVTSSSNSLARCVLR